MGNCSVTGTACACGSCDCIYSCCASGRAEEQCVSCVDKGRRAEKVAAEE